METSKRHTVSAPLMVAVGPKDKENLATPDSILKIKKGTPVKSGRKSLMKNNSKECNKNFAMIKNQINNLTSEQKVKKQITAEDLTTTGSPGEAYWEQLSESRRVALEATLKENAGLHKKIMELEYENTKLKAMLAEAKTSIQLLTEILEENEEANNSDNDPNTESCDEVDDSVDDISFTSV